jgi:hypothetical protein
MNEIKKHIYEILSPPGKEGLKLINNIERQTEIHDWILHIRGLSEKTTGFLFLCIYKYYLSKGHSGFSIIFLFCL